MSLDDYKATGGLKGLTPRALMTQEAIVDEVVKSGLRGRGGAGFPTGIKWKTVMQAAGPQKYVVCNADEGDSGTFADRMVMEGDPFLLIEGMIIAGIASGADRGYVYLRSEYPHAIAVMNEAVEVAKAPACWALTCSAAATPLRWKCVSAPVPMCAARRRRCSTVSKASAARFAPSRLCLRWPACSASRPSSTTCCLWPQSPTSWPMAQKPTRRSAFGRSRGTMPVQLAGNIRHGGLFEVPFGITLGELVNDIGGGTASGRPVRAVQVGGPLGAYFPPALFDTPFDYEAFAARDGLIGHGGVVVFDDTVDMAGMARFAMEFCAVESCGKCTPCRIGSVRGLEVMDRIIAGDASQIPLLEDLCDTMKFGSLCALGGFTPYPVLSALRHYPEDFTRNRLPMAAE